jgi:outer membrane protein assembly factor BamB
MLSWLNKIWQALKSADVSVKNLGSMAMLLTAFVLATFIFLQENYSPQKNSSLDKKDKFPKAQSEKIDPNSPGFATLWLTDFNNNRVIGFAPDGKVPWIQNMSAEPIPAASWYFIGGIENVTVAPNGNLITVHGDGMMVQEIDRKTHNLVWQYGTAGIQTYRGGALDEPDKSYKFNDHEVVINDGNDREVIVVDQNTNQVVWQYGQYHAMSSAPGFLRGNTSVVPLEGGKQFLITDTIDKRIIIVDRATKNIVWEFSKPDAKWLQNVFPTKDGTFVLEDRLKGEVFEVNRDGQILWTLSKLSDESHLSGPTDTAKLLNGHVLIAENGRQRIVEAIPQTGEVVRQYLIHGLASSIAIDKNSVDFADNQGQQAGPVQSDSKTIVVEDAGKAIDNKGGSEITGGGQIFEGEIIATNPSTGKAGSLTIKNDGTTYGIEVYNYSRVIDKAGALLSLMAIQKRDRVSITGTISGTYIKANRVQDNSR